MTPPGIDPGTVRLVARRLNHYATPGPLHCCNTYYKPNTSSPRAMTPSEDGCILAVDDVTVIQILCKSHNTSDDNIKHVFHKINYSIHFRVKVKVMALSVTSRCDT